MLLTLPSPVALASAEVEKTSLIDLLPEVYGEGELVDLVREIRAAKRARAQPAVDPAESAEEPPPAVVPAVPAPVAADPAPPPESVPVTPAAPAAPAACLPVPAPISPPDRRPRRPISPPPRDLHDFTKSIGALRGLLQDSERARVELSREVGSLKREAAEQRGRLEAYHAYHVALTAILSKHPLSRR